MNDGRDHLRRPDTLYGARVERYLRRQRTQQQLELEAVEHDLRRIRGEAQVVAVALTTELGDRVGPEGDGRVVRVRRVGQVVLDHLRYRVTRLVGQTGIK